MKKLNIFCIDDCKEDLLLIRHALEGAGHDVTTCSRILMSQDILGRIPFDVILVDKNMGCINGFMIGEWIDDNTATPWFFLAGETNGATNLILKEDINILPEILAELM